MHIVLMTLGSRGDVQPLVALGVELQKVGHACTVATHDNFRTFVQRHGLGFSPLAGDSRELIESEEVQRIFELGQGYRWLTAGAAWLAAQHEQLVKDCLAACSKAEAILYNPITYPAWHIAQAMQVPSFACCYWPTTPTASFPYPLFGMRELGLLNRLSYRVFEQLVWSPLAKNTNALRRSLGLPALPAWGPYWLPEYKDLPWLYPYSQAVIPRPGDWPGNQTVTGYWFLDAAKEYSPPAELVRFLDAGEPPVAIGFGSMVPRASASVTRKVIEAVERAQSRAVLLAGWGGLNAKDLPDTCLQVDEVPHDWLFPQVGAVVCHAGAGTIGAALRAGRPVLGCPIIGDQYLWSRRMSELGVGPKPVPYSQLSAEGLGKAIVDLLRNKGYAQQAGELQQSICAERGVADAVEIIQHQLRTRSTKAMNELAQ